MQLYALDCQHQLISASKALKQQDYRCVECLGTVRTRSGLHRHAHFFHLRPVSTCRLSSKSMAHLQIQCHLQRLLPKGECDLERRFPAINRIADAAWLPQKLIFEIQCSSITAEEIAARNADYASLGFQVVWILHDRQFNQYRLSAAELLLRSCPYFFSDMSPEGQGCIYDQFDIYNRGLRLKKMGRLPVDLSKPSTLPEQIVEEVPQMLLSRIQAWPLHFEGDLIDMICYGTEYMAEALRLEKELFPPPLPKNIYGRLLEWGWKFILRPYQLLFQMFLEKSCK